jgi:hypothetical protein
MTKPRCDPIEIQVTLSVLAERGCGLVGGSRDPAALRRLYADYASVATRPYAGASWAKVLRAAFPTVKANNLLHLHCGNWSPPLTNG